jgi:amino acid adenylation domain-containing protein
MTLDDLAGFFVNTLVLRTNLSGDPTFRELVQRVRKFDQDAYSHQDVPFERVVQAVRPERSLSRQPLFQVMLLLQAELVLAGLAAKPEPFQWESAKFDLTLSLQERHESEREPAGLNGFLEYASDLFNRQMAEDIAARFVRLLETISSHSDFALHDLSLLSISERGILTSPRVVCGADTVAVPAPTQFEAMAALHPGATAAIFAGESLSYAELNARANRVAHLLIRQGVLPGAIVGISLPRSFDMLVALLATLKAGAAYLPLDPSYPQARLQAMIADAQPALVLDSPLIDTSLYPDHNPAVLITPDHPAYVLYTSGSTGTPKGVLIRHAELARYLAWAGALYESSEGCGAPVNTPLAFDATITSLWLPLLAGKTVFLLPDQEFIPALGDLLTSGQDFTLVKLTPAHLTALADYLGDRATEVRSRRFVVGGEALKAPVANFWSRHVPGLHIVNEYGPTETVVGCCVHIMEPGEQVSGDVPIGFATQGTRLYVLDRWLEPVPLGVWGELYIGGPQVGVGYLNRKALTAERFIADRWTGSGARMYRTGDWVRRRQDGTLEFEGRTDQQVKIRGFRIELGEIEAALTAQPGISQAVAVARDGGQQQPRLVAYVIPAAGTQIDTASLRKALAEQLPDYMVPAAFVAIEHFPLSTNGKIDRTALPEPELPSNNYRTPRTPAEAVVCRVMREIFDIDQVGADDDFFELGGNSLSATRVASRLNEAFKVVLPIRVIFEYPKFSDLGAEIERLSAAIITESDEADEVIDLWI